MTGRLANKKVLLLGAGSVGDGIGNGRAMAILFAREGADIVGVDLDLAAAEETARLVKDEGRDMIAVAGDVTDAADLARVIEEAQARLGRIDILVNNVGGSIAGGPEEITPEQWDAQFRFNVDSVHPSTRILAPRMAAQGGGAIVNISSIAGVRHLGHDLAAYAASKAALQQYSKVVAVRYAPQNVRINTVIPGLMFTPLVRVRLAPQQAGGDAEALIAKRHAKPPMGRMGDAWDVAYAALYLASDEARYVTGAEIMVDGGLSNTTR
ncbi:MAG: SDR family oxidoreductase [Methylobacteriaceae bacterium]|nr:SDR family oxidoreductase [Methylobacteriaceae bacterium]